MATYLIQPVDVISAPNFFSPLSDNRWVITGQNAVTLWGILQIQDNLGVRRYIPATGSTLQAVFMRKDAVNLTQTYPLQVTNTTQNVTINAALNASDRSLFSLTLTAQDAANVVSGSVKFTLTESSIANTWVQDWLLQKKIPQTGC
jgi:hypothetical protein